MAGTTIGVVGAPWRATVTPWGQVEPWDGTPPLRWWIAGDDRWYDPAAEATVRQRLLDGTPVVETTVRVPGGDAVQRVFAVADGCTVVDVENRSPLPFAVAFSRPDLLVARPPTDLPVPGIELPAGSVVLPVAHRTTLRVALPHGGGGPGPLPPGLPTAQQVARGWVTQLERRVRFVLPEHGEAVTAARAALVLEGVPAPEEPADFLLGLRELVRLGERPAPWVVEVAAAVEGLASTMRHRAVPWQADAAFAAAAEVLAAAGEQRASGDVAAVRRRLGRVEPRPAQAPAGVGVLAWVESLVARETDGGADLWPGYPVGWLGQGAEAYRVPVGAVDVSVAVRWHGERPALLWECTATLTLTCRRLDPSWSSSAAKGEALLGPPALA